MPPQGATIWFTGLPASGKSTIARAVVERLQGRGLPVELLAGAEVRESLSRGLGFTPQDRDEHLRRIGYVAKLLSRNGVIVVCTAVSPYRATRDEIRRNVRNFVEVFVDCPDHVAEQRDAAGRYARARRGELSNFTGVNAPYEAPVAPEVHLRSDVESISQSASKIIRTLELMGIIPATPDSERSVHEEEIRRRLAALGYI